MGQRRVFEAHRFAVSGGASRRLDDTLLPTRRFESPAVTASVKRPAAPIVIDKGIEAQPPTVFPGRLSPSLPRIDVAPLTSSSFPSPTTQQSIAPISAPATMHPTTMNPTTMNPSTVNPSTVNPSTVQPPSEEIAAAHGIRQAMVFSTPPIGQTLTVIPELIDAGEIKPQISSVLPLKKIRQAHEMIEAKHTRGKIVLQVAA